MTQISREPTRGGAFPHRLHPVLQCSMRLEPHPKMKGPSGEPERPYSRGVPRNTYLDRLLLLLLSNGQPPF